MPDVIKPTIGRVVLYRPHPGNILDQQMTVLSDEPMAATVTFVWSDQMVNLSVMDHNGHHHERTSVYLAQPGDEENQSAPYCTWMPYQIGQAAKAEELEKEVESLKDAPPPADAAA